MLLLFLRLLFHLLTNGAGARGPSLATNGSPQSVQDQLTDMGPEPFPLKLHFKHLC